MYLVFATLIFFSAMTHATPQSDLRDYLESKTFIINTPLMGFNYNDLSAEPTSPSQFVDLIKQSAEEFYNEDSTVDYTVGPGFYLATGAYGSRIVFGKNDPRLTVAVIKVGTKILNGRYIDEDSERDDQAKILKALGCYYENGDFIWRLRYHRRRQCKKALLSAMHDLRIGGMVYPWEDREKLAGCPGVSAIAFNMISPDAIDFTKTNYYSDRLKIENEATMSDFIVQLYNESLSGQGYNPAMIRQGYDQYHPPKFLSPSSAKISDGEYKKLKSDLIWSCGTH